MSSRGLIQLMLLSLLALAACSADRDPDSLFAPGSVDIPVVDAVLVVDQPLPRLLLTRTQPPDEAYSLADAAIRDATVYVVTGEGDTIHYVPRAAPGAYDPEPFPVPVVEPERRYHLTVITDRGERITASTTTPARLALEAWVLAAGQGNPADRTLRTFAELGDGVYDAPENQLIYPEGVLEGRLAVDEALGYQLALFSLDLGADFVIDPPFFDEDDFASLERNVSSPVLEATDGAIGLPWFAVYFASRYLYKVQALDRNAYDLVRSTPQGGFGVGGNAGDNFERPIYNVEGGIGLFGSVSVDSVGFRVLPAP